MTKIKAIIIDDEIKLQELLSIKLTKHFPNMKVLAKASDIDSGYQKILELKPDVVFLDISMPGGSGFDLLNRFETFNFQVVFVTGYSEYALDALKLSATDYILKPINLEELRVAVKKVEENLSNSLDHGRLKALKQNLNTKNTGDQIITIPNHNSYEFLQIKDIIHAEGWERYTKVHTTDGQVLTSSYSIGSYVKQLQDYSFYQCHKSHIINENHIKRYTTDGNVLLSNGNNVPVARRKREEFMSRFVRI